MTQSGNRTEALAELICELTRFCNINEELFAASFNLSPTEVRFLKLFVFEDTLAIKEIKEKLNLSAGRISHISQSLVAKQLLTRISDDSDKRNIIVKLHPNASPYIKNLHQSYQRLHNDLLKNVTVDEMNTIYHSLEILVEIFKNRVNEK